MLDSIEQLVATRYSRKKKAEEEARAAEQSAEGEPSTEATAEVAAEGEPATSDEAPAEDGDSSTPPPVEPPARPQTPDDPAEDPSTS